MQTLTYIAVNFNNWDVTKKMCISLANQQPTESPCAIQCLIVNNSVDPSDSKALHEYCCAYPWLTVIDCPDNPGYFGGLNRGLAALAAEQRGWVVIGNNDLEYADDFSRKLSSLTFPADALALCPDVVTLDGVHQNPHIQKPISSLRRFQFDLYYSHYFVACILKQLRKLSPKKRPTDRDMVPQEIHMGVGACYVLTPAFFRHFTSLNCPVYLYGEEAFFSEQIHQAGGRVWFAPELKVAHAESAALGKMPSRTTYEFARDGFHLYRDLM